MRRGVDAAGETGDDHMAFAADLPRHLACEFPRDGGGIACPHDGNAAPVHQREIALGADQRWRCVRLAQQRRIIRFFHGDETRANRFCVGHVALGGVAPIDARWTAKAALARQIGQYAQGFACRPKSF